MQFSNRKLLKKIQKIPHKEIKIAEQRKKDYPMGGQGGVTRNLSILSHILRWPKLKPTPLCRPSQSPRIYDYARGQLYGRA